MKQTKYYIALLLTSTIILFAPSIASAQTMMTQQNTYSSNSTTYDEQKGWAIYNQLQNKQTTCSKLTNSDFDVLGDFYMGRMMSTNHAAMDRFMADKLGINGETQVHITIGKRLSGCDVNASYPSSINNYSSLSWMNGMSMMNDNGWGGMMNDFNDSAWSWTSMALALLLIISVTWNIIMWQGQAKTKQTAGISRKKS